MNYDIARLRLYLQDYFSADELNILLFDYFPTVRDEFTPGMVKSQQILLLLDHCQRNGRLPDLLAALQRQRGAAFNPNDYLNGPPPTELSATGRQPPTTTLRNPRQIFLSHAHQDAELAHKLAYDLEAHGYAIWIAPDSIRPGEKWAEAINRGLEESGLFILLLTPEAVASQWVKTETNIAIELNHEDEMHLYPLLVKACRLPALWRAYQFISLLRGGYERGLNHLLAALERQVSIASTVQSQPVASFRSPGGYIVRGTGTYTAPETQIQPLATPDKWIHTKTGLEMVRVPAGDFLFWESDEGDELETVYLDEFWIAKTPVTNVEYKRFLDANPAYPVPIGLSTFLDETKAYNWDKQYRHYPEGKANHPVVLVSWQDAKAYAEWAGVELPTDVQWEKAARGTDGREFPWGDDWRDAHCNTIETGIGSTTPVGQFSPQGDSPFGCVDMSGNVWEWVESVNVQGVIRGGSWRDEASYAGSENHQSWSSTHHRLDHIGFRVVVRRPPS